MSSVGAASSDRATHSELQREIFNSKVSSFVQPLPEDVQQRLQQISQAIPDLGPASRVIDVGSGTGCLIPHLQSRGVQDILAVDLSENMLAELKKRYCNTSSLGNEPGVRTWLGDVVDLPAYQGPADALFMNGVFGNLHDPRDALLRAALLLKPAGHVVLSHAMGRAWHTSLHEQDPVMVPHKLPDRQALEKLVWDLPLEVVDFVDEPDLYVATLQVPPKYAFSQSPLFLEGPVVTGFGRGSCQLGVPTANIDPVPLADTLRQLPKGVYFGWASLDAADPADRGVHKMVMNIGRRPTVSQGAEGLEETVEVHILNRYSQDFYGKRLRVVALGYLRPEMRFAGGIKELVARIRADVAISKNQLDDPEWAKHQQDSRLQAT